MERIQELANLAMPWLQSHCPACVKVFLELKKNTTSQQQFILTYFLALMPIWYSSARVRYVIRLIFFALLTAAGSIVGFAIAIACTLSGQRRYILYVVGRFFGLFLRVLFNIRVIVETPDFEETLRKQMPCVIVCNHQSSVDLLVMASIFPAGAVVLCKESILYYPLMGQFLWLANNIFVNRKNHAQALKSMERAAKQVRENKLALFVYPEGTRSRPTKVNMLPFKKGAFHLAVQAQVPIVPLVFSIYNHAYSSRQLRFDGGNIYVRALKPIQTKGRCSEETDAIMQETRQSMLEALEELDKLPKH